MKLEELIPSKPTFKIQKTGKEYTLRVPNASDKVEWIALAGSPEQLNEALRKTDWSVCIRLVYSLLVEKNEFKAEQKTFIDNEGFEVTKYVTGPTKLLQEMEDTQDIVSVMSALGLAITLSDPVAREMYKEESKKKLASRKTQSTGEKSLTL